MAFFECSFFSQTLAFDTNVCVYIPTPDENEISGGTDRYFRKGVKFQTLYLLHGAFGDCSDWIRQTCIERYAWQRRLALVMPSGDNSFYQDMCRGSKYLSYCSEELPGFVRSVFPLSPRREDTFIAGLSMGGYGALRIAFEKPDMFYAAASLSGALDLADIFCRVKNDEIALSFPWENTVENMDAVESSGADLFARYAVLKTTGKKLPMIFQCCGTEDFLYQSNQLAKQKFTALGADLHYEEDSGEHNWDYWESHIEKALDWLPLKKDSIPDEELYAHSV
jgi:S-formylglutathione hydrolase FrmB